MSAAQGRRWDDVVLDGRHAKRLIDDLELARLALDTQAHPKLAALLASHIRELRELAQVERL